MRRANADTGYTTATCGFRHQWTEAHVPGNHQCTWQTISNADNLPKVNRSFVMGTNMHIIFVKGKGCNVNEPSLSWLVLLC